MITGAIRNQIDQIWNEFWSGGIAKRVRDTKGDLYNPQGPYALFPPGDVDELIDALLRIRQNAVAAQA